MPAKKQGHTFTVLSSERVELAKISVPPWRARLRPDRGVRLRAEKLLLQRFPEWT